MEAERRVWTRAKSWKIEDGRRERREQSQSGGYWERSSGSLRAAPRKTTNQQKRIRRKHVSFYAGPSWLPLLKVQYSGKKNHLNNFCLITLYNFSQ